MWIHIGRNALLSFLFRYDFAVQHGHAVCILSVQTLYLNKAHCERDRFITHVFSWALLSTHPKHLLGVECQKHVHWRQLMAEELQDLSLVVEVWGWGTLVASQGRGHCHCTGGWVWLTYYVPASLVTVLVPVSQCCCYPLSHPLHPVSVSSDGSSSSYRMLATPLFLSRPSSACSCPAVWRWSLMDQSWTWSHLCDLSDLSSFPGTYHWVLHSAWIHTTELCSFSNKLTPYSYGEL